MFPVHIHNALVEWLALRRHFRPRATAPQMSARVGGIIGLPCGRDPTQAGAVSHRALVHQAYDQSDGNRR
jgi:hypothetical protein